MITQGERNKVRVHTCPVYVGVLIMVMCLIISLIKCDLQEIAWSFQHHYIIRHAWHGENRYNGTKYMLLFVTSTFANRMRLELNSASLQGNVICLSGSVQNWNSIVRFWHGWQPSKILFPSNTTAARSLLILSSAMSSSQWRHTLNVTVIYSRRP